MDHKASFETCSVRAHMACGKWAKAKDSGLRPLTACLQQLDGGIDINRQQVAEFMILNDAQAQAVDVFMVSIDVRLRK